MIFSFHLVFYDRKPFSSILTEFNNLSCNKWPHLFHQKFSLLTYDLKKKIAPKIFLQRTFQKCRRSHLQMFFKIVVFKNFAIFTSKYLLESFLIKLHIWRPATLLKRPPQHRCLPVTITKFLRLAFFMGHLWWLLLKMV